MSIRQGKKLIASSTTNGFGLFDCKWADHILNNISWLRADTFSWQSGDVYKAAYEHLLSDFENRSGVMFYAWKSDQYGYYLYTTTTTPDSTTVFYDEEFQVDTEHTFSSFDGDILYLDDAPEPEISFQRDPSKDTIAPSIDTVGDVSITYYLADDGHKICLSDQEANISSLYENTGVAWYYILDAENKRFKLPRTKFGFTGIRNGVGGYVEAGLPNITGSQKISSDIGFASSVADQGSSIYSKQATIAKYYSSASSSANRTVALAIDASRSSPVYGNSNTVQPQATEMYLYFYVGNYVENATTIDVGKLTEIVNDFDIDSFKPEVDEARNSAIVDISDAKTDAIDTITNLATDLGTSLKYGNVGDIFYTSRLDVSLNGAVECNGNLYNTTDFSGAQSIGNLLRDSKVPYISLSEHQTTVDTYGSCRCFGWDGGTEFRVPKLADVFIEAGIAATEGEFITAGLPNITGTMGEGLRAYNTTGSFYALSSYTKAPVDGNYTSTNKAGFDASRSSSIYGNSTTVQPPAVRYRAMVQLAFGATDDAVVTAGNVVADVSMLKNRFFVPDYGNGTILSPNATHTVPSNGYLLIRCNENATTGNITINGTTIALCYLYKASKDIEGGSLSTLPVAKGDVFSTAVRDAWIMFCPVKYV